MTATITGHNYSNNIPTSTVTVNAGGDVTIAGGGYRVIAGTGNSVSLSDSSGGVYTVTASNVAAGATTPFGQPTGIFLADATAANITGDMDSVTLGNNDTLNIIGGGNTISAGLAQALYTDGESGYFYVSNNQPWLGDFSDLYYGNDGTLYAAAEVDDVINISNTHGVADILKVSGVRVGGSITLANTCQATLTGGGNQVNLGTGDTLTVTGGNNAISGGIHNTVNVTGYQNTLTLSNSTLITLSNTTTAYLKNSVIGDSNIITDNCASRAGVDIIGNSNTITATQTNALLTITGDNNIATLSGTNSVANISGTGSRVTTTNNSINLTTAGTLTVTGNGNTFTGVIGSTITNNLSNGTSKVYAWDANNVETITSYNHSNGTGTVTGTQSIYFLDYFATYTGNNNTVVGSGFNTITGNSNTITENPGTSITINGINNKLSMDGGNITQSVAGKLTVTGDGNSFAGVANALIIQNTSDGQSQTYSWDASGDELITNFTGTNGTGTATLYTVQGFETITVAAKNSDVTIGNANTVTFTKTGNDVSIEGSNNDITSSNNTFNLDSGVTGSWEHFHGNSNTINASNEIITISGNNNIINGTGNTISQTSANKLVVNGDGNTYSGVASSTITNNTSNGRSTVYRWNASNVETISTYFLANGIGLPLTVQTIYSVGDGQTKTITSTGNTVNIGNNATATITGTGNVINGGQFDTINSSSNTINAGNGDYIVGNNNAINGQNDSLAVSGSGNVITGAGNSIDLLSATTLTVTGDGNTYGGVANATIINNHSAGGSTVYRWDASAGETCTNYSGTGGTGTITGTGTDPLILSLTGADVDTQSLSGSAARFDMQNNGKAVQTGWATAGEGILVYDPAHPDAPITQDSQLVGSFAALSTLDSNHDGQISSLDSAWSDLKVWVDKTGTAQYTSDSLYSLSDLHIASIDLHATTANRDSHGNAILADSSYTKTDGSKGDIAGVSLSYQAATEQLINALASFAPAAAGQASGEVSADHLQAVPIAVHG